ncbi:hypothetical protein DFJ77DRAFT_506606 [Powellomyces hirtus]|nr:hypothetical protein DFJ77DRAFT_506606 [Powellomyces hirtus]
MKYEQAAESNVNPTPPPPTNNTNPPTRRREPKHRGHTCPDCGRGKGRKRTTRVEHTTAEPDHTTVIHTRGTRAPVARDAELEHRAGAYDEWGDKEGGLTTTPLEFLYPSPTVDINHNPPSYYDNSTAYDYDYAHLAPTASVLPPSPSATTAQDFFWPLITPDCEYPFVAPHHNPAGYLAWPDLWTSDLLLPPADVGVMMVVWPAAEAQS